MIRLSLTADQADVLALVDSVTSSPDGDAQREALVESGLWSVGMAEALGGGGAPLDLRLAALVGLGRSWPAQAWASAQAHAALELLDHDQNADLSEKIVDGRVSVCVVDLRTTLAPRVGGASPASVVVRLDPAGEEIHAVLVDGDHVRVAGPEDLAIVHASTCGLRGSSTVFAEVTDHDDGLAGGATGTEVERVLGVLRLSGAAIAAGLAVEAASRSIEYARGRLQFGGPLTALPTVRASLHEQSASAEQLVASVLGADPASRSATSWLLENACDQAVTTAAAAIQSHGGYGYLSEYGVDRILRDAVSLRAATAALGHARGAAGVLAPTA